MVQNNKWILVGLLIWVSLYGQVKLSVKTIPKKVNIILDGTNIGKSPIINDRISPGLHKFKIEKSGFAPITYEILVNPSQAVHLDFFMNPIYQVKFKTQEKGLVFELNGEHLWDDQFIRLDLEAGDHFLRVFKLNEIIDEQTIHVDEPKKFNYYLKKLISEK
mgnify:FL=1